MLSSLFYSAKIFLFRDIKFERKRRNTLAPMDARNNGNLILFFFHGEMPQNNDSKTYFMK